MKDIKIDSLKAERERLLSKLTKHLEKTCMNIRKVLHVFHPVRKSREQSQIGYVH